MARLASIGFELNSKTNDVEVTLNNGSTYSVQSSIVRSGNLAANFASASSQFDRADYNFATTGSPIDGEIFARVYVYITSAPNALCNLMLLGDSGANIAGQIRLATNRTLELWNSSAKIGSSSSALALGVWYKVELRAVTNNGAGADVLEGRLEGVSFASSSAQTLGALYRVLIGPNSSSVTTNFTADDLVINNTSGSFQNSWPTDGKIIHLKPNAAGDNASWTRGGPDSGINYGQVDELTPNDNTDFVWSNTLNQIDDYNIESPAVMGASDTINCVQVGVRYRGGGASSNHSFVLRIKASASGTVEESSAITPTDSTWVTNASSAPRNYSLTLYDLPGASTTPWTKADLETAQIGQRVSATSTNSVNISTLWLLVDYTPSGTYLAAMSNNSSTTGTAVSVSAPDNKAGDIVVVSVHANGSTTIVDNNGSTPFTENINDYQPNTSSGHTVSIFSRRIQSGDPTTYNFTIGASGRWSVIAANFRNPHATDIYDVLPSTSNAAEVNDTANANITAPTITTTTNNALHIICAYWDTANLGSTTPPSGYVKIAERINQPQGMALKAIDTAAATGAQTYTSTESNPRMALSFAIKDVSASSVIDVTVNPGVQAVTSSMPTPTISAIRHTTQTPAVQTIAVSLLAPIPAPPVAVFEDDFEFGGIDVGKWSNYGGGQVNATTNLMLELTTTTWPGYYGMLSLGYYSLIGSSVFSQLVDAGNQSLSSFEVYPIQLSNGANAVSIMVAGNTVYARKKVGGASDTVGTSVGYNSATMKWFRIRESGGTTYWEYATNPTSTWTLIASAANPITLTKLQVEVLIGTWDGEGSTTTAKIDNINVLPEEYQFDWKGYTWHKRIHAADPANNQFWSPDNVEEPDGSDYIKVKLTNPTGNGPAGSEIFTDQRGFGYGTYTTVIGTRLDNIGAAIGFGGMFTFDFTAPPDYKEIDIHETRNTVAGVVEANKQILKNHVWNNGGSREFITDHMNIPSDVVQTHRLIWTPTELIFDSFIGTGTGGTNYFHSVHTTNLPTPGLERVHFNIFADTDVTGYRAATPLDVVIRDFSFVSGVSASTNPSVQTATFSQPTATIVAVRQVSVGPAVQAVAASLIAPTISTLRTASVSPAAQTATVTLIAPTVSTQVSVAPSAGVQTVAVSLINPTITVTRSVIVTPTSQDTTLSLPAATIATVRNVTSLPAVQSVTASLIAPGISVGDQVTPAPVLLDLIVLSPTIAASGQVTISPAVLSVTTSVPAPTISPIRNVAQLPSAQPVTMSLPGVTVVPTRTVTHQAQAQVLTASIVQPTIGLFIVINVPTASLSFASPTASVNISTGAYTRRAGLGNSQGNLYNRTAGGLYNTK